DSASLQPKFPEKTQIPRKSPPYTPRCPCFFWPQWVALFRSPVVETLTNLAGLSARLRLPAPWLRAEALAGRIPCLKVGRRLLSNPRAVEEKLAQRAALERQEASCA